MTAFLITIIVLALIFDYINGFHDAANSIATVVSTKVLTPFQAVLWAALFNFVAFFIFKDHGVANTIAKTVKNDFITLEVIFSGLIAAIFWNLFTWWRGIPFFIIAHTYWRLCRRSYCSCWFFWRCQFGASSTNNPFYFSRPAYRDDCSFPYFYLVY